MNRYLTTPEDVRSLALAGATLTQVRVATSYIDLILELPGTGTAEIRVEARGTVTSGGDAMTTDAGPTLGSQVLSLLDTRIDSVESRGLDLLLTFGPERTLVIHVDHSGYESYSVTISGDTWVAIGAASDE